MKWFIFLLVVQELTMAFTLRKACRGITSMNSQNIHPSIPSTGTIPTNDHGNSRNNLLTYIKSLSTLGAMSALLNPVGQKANAIGTLYELKDQNIVIQDLAFNVENTVKDASAMQALFQDFMKPIRSRTVNNMNTTVMAFGSDAYNSPKTFYPGVSTFYEDGGHATITLNAQRLEKDDDVAEIYEKGNGLLYVKIGAEVIRLSKAIQNGANIGFAYGWVDLDTPGKIPLEVIVGISRDPLMLTCLRVKSVSESTDFFINQLGMKSLQFPIARSIGSDYEPTQPLKSSCVGYGENSMSLLLVSGAKDAPPLNIGTVLQAITLVYDQTKIDTLPPLFQNAAKGGEKRVLSPDGYPFVLKSYEEYQKQIL